MTIIDLLNSWKSDMIKALLKNGEWDEVCYIGWVHDLNCVCEVRGCTDVLGVYVSRCCDGISWGIDVLMHDEWDKKEIFADLEDLPLTIADEVHRQIMCYYGN